MLFEQDDDQVYLVQTGVDLREWLTDAELKTRCGSSAAGVKAKADAIREWRQSKAQKQALMHTHGVQLHRNASATTECKVCTGAAVDATPLESKAAAPALKSFNPQWDTPGRYR